MLSPSQPGPGPGVHPVPGLAWFAPLLCLEGGLLALWAATDSALFPVLVLLVALTILATGLVVAAGWTRAQQQTAQDEARLNELEPLPPASAEWEDRP